MRHIFLFTTIFILFSTFTAENTSAAPLGWENDETEFSLLPNQPMFSTDVDIFLGQKKRRGGGRVWGNLYYGDTTLKPIEGYKIKPNFYGFQLGLEIPNGHGVRSVLFFNLNESKTDFADANSKIDNYLLGYGKLIFRGMCHFAFVGNIAYDKYEVSAARRTATGDGLQTNLFGEFGLDFMLGQWGIKPFYALQYDFLYHGNIGERSTVLVSDWNGHGLQQLVGTRLIWNATSMLELQGRAVWVHEMLDNPPPFYHARFSPGEGTRTPAMMFFNGDTGRDWAWLGIGAKLKGILSGYLYCDYDVLFNKRHVTHLGSLGICLGW